MSALVRTELLKLATTRSPRMLAAATIGLSAVMALASVAGAGRRQAPSIGTAGAVLKLLAGFGQGPLLVMVLGALVACTEHRHGTITATLLTTPRRIRLAAARAVAVGLVATALGVLGLLYALAIGVAAGAVGPGTAGQDLAIRCLGLLLAYPAFAVLGLGIGTLLPRFPAVAAILPAAWVLLLENLVLSSFTRHLPVWAISRVSEAAANADDVAPLLPVWAGVAGLIAYAGIGWVAGAVRLARSDIA
jgi:hypothetical protein